MVKPNYSSKDATELLRYAENIFKEMTKNAALFPDPVPTLAVFEQRLNDYRSAFAEAGYRDVRAVVIKGQKGRDLQEAIYRLSHYVDAIARGDESVILAAGYRPSQSNQNRVGRTPKAKGVRVEYVQVGSGVIRIKVQPWEPARLYQYDYRKKNELQWTSMLNPTATLQLDGLEHLQEYEFRVSYLGKDVTPNFSDVISAFVV